MASLAQARGLSGHWYIMAVADRQGFICVGGVQALAMVPLAHCGRTDLTLRNHDKEAALVAGEQELVAHGFDLPGNRRLAVLQWTSNCRRWLRSG